MRTLIEEGEIQREVERLGRHIAEDYRGQSVTILGVMTGSIVLLSDLIRKIDLPLRVGLIQASSYQGRSTSPGSLSVSLETLPSVKGQDVLLVDDIFDTGQTMAKLLDELRRQRPASIRSAVLLLKEGRSKVDFEPDYHCFRIPNVFVVGYGLDYNDEYRHLPHIAAIDDKDL